jgi:hypothetical protein
MIDAERKLKAVRRELAFRKSLYPKWVEMGRIDKDYQDYIDANAEQGKLL